jgi:DNA-binding NtrC family response regulator
MGYWKNGMNKTTVMVCDDEQLIRWSLCEHLGNEGYRVVAVADAKQLLQRLDTEAPMLILLDLKMPGMGGMQALRKLRTIGCQVPVIIMTAHGGTGSAIEATKLGASDYIEKPFDLRTISFAVRRALHEYQINSELHYHRGRSDGTYGQFIGSAPSLNSLFSTLGRLEKIDPPTILILGESGTGKSLIARAFHERGIRSNRPFMEIDCTTLPENLIESELFGHEQGAFTDAKNTKRGLLEVAADGVVFLDEIGELAPATQAKFLGALETRRFKRVGGVVSIPLRATIVAATNRDIKQEVKSGKFREDLYFRLNVIPIRLPSLRERKEDILELATHFLSRFSKTIGCSRKAISGQAMNRLIEYSWPGNVRELRNVMERLTILSAEDVISISDLPPEICYANVLNSSMDGSDVAKYPLPENGLDLLAVERSLLTQAITRTRGNQSAAARLLGLTRYQFRYRFEKHGLIQTDE